MHMHRLVCRLKMAALLVSVLITQRTDADPSAPMEGVLDLTPATFDQHVGLPGGKAALVEFYAPWCGHCKSMSLEWEKIGFAAKDNAKIIIAKVDADEHHELMKRFGIEGFPTIKYFPPRETSADSVKHEDYDDDRDAESMASFLNERLDTGIKILTVPSAVVLLAAESFDSVVLDSTKHVFVEFFAPWCGHCKQLKPKYEAVARAFKAETEIIIAAVDADSYAASHLVKRYDIKGFPTLLWFSKHNKKGVNYKGPREIMSIVEFINVQARVSRTMNGKIGSSAGTRPGLNMLASEYWKSMSDADKALLDFAVKEAGVEKYGFYQDIANGIKTHGKDWIEQEKERIETQIQSLTDERDIEVLAIKLNQLHVFKPSYDWNL